MKFRLLWGLLILVLVGVLGAFAWSHGPSISAPPKGADPSAYGQAPFFRLTDQNNQSFDSSRLKGKAWIADFIFTSCAGSCPEMTQKMSALRSRLKPEVQLVSFSVDPTRDTPAALSEYARRYGADQRWHFLTGADSKQLRSIVMDGFRLSLGTGTDAQEPIIHSIRFVLVDREGRVRGGYDSSDPKKLGQLIEDANAL